MSSFTLQQLQQQSQKQSQKQAPITRVQIAENLTEFPVEIFELADSLEILDLSNNQLSNLPDQLDTLVNLRILFLTNNHFETIPAVLARCPKLEMISFKSNRLTHIDEGVLPRDTRWLILTDNKLRVLPESMGQLHRLQKLALAGNGLTHLPESMANCKNLELARLSANRLSAMPDWLFELPKLAWLAFSGNEFNRAEAASHSSVMTVALENIRLGELIGEGASGLIYQADWIKQPLKLNGNASDKSRDNNAPIAVKLFKGDITSDGYPQDELDCCLRAGEHDNLIKVIAQLDLSDAEAKLGLVMALIPKSFYNLGLPPTLQSCTRDTFESGTTFDLETIVKIIVQMAKTLAHLHKNTISHGDVYAHNTMVNDQADMLFGDFGAATNLMSLPQAQQSAMERIEVRAFGNLLEDLLQLNEAKTSDEQALYSELKQRLKELKNQCIRDDVEQRPSFSALLAQCEALTKSTMMKINTKGHL